MSEQDEDRETSHWKTISAEELAASRKEAIRERLGDARCWLGGLINVLQEDLERDLLDKSLSPAAREIAETNLQTLLNQGPALILVLDQLPSRSRAGAFSIVFNLLSAVHGRKKEMSDDLRKRIQAAKARDGRTERAAERKKVILKYRHLDWDEAEPLIDAETTKKRLKKVSRSLFYEVCGPKKSRS